MFKFLPSSLYLAAVGLFSPVEINGSEEKKQDEN